MVTWFDESRLDDESALAARRRAACGRWPRPARGYAARPARPRRRPPRRCARGRRAGATARGDRRRARTPGCCGRCSSRGARCRSWPGPGPALPGWAGSLDLVVVLAPDGSDTGTASAVAEAVRRGCQVVVACPPSSMVAEHAAGRWSTILPDRRPATSSRPRS